MKKQIMCIAAAVLFAAMSFPAFAAVTVPNFSFESPVLTTTNYSDTIDNWEDRAQTGVFKNNGVNGSVITNANGAQMAYMDCRPVISGAIDNIWQDIPGSSLEAKTYVLTVGVAGRSDKVPTDKANTKMELRFYTRAGSVLTVLAVKEVVYSNLSNTALKYYSVTLNAADIPPAQLGKVFGIWLISTVGTTGGVWTLDNVTLTIIPRTAASNPTPANGSTNIGTAININDVAVDLGWDTGRDPNDLVDLVYSDITDHYLYLVAGDPNFVAISPIVIPAGTPVQETASYSATLNADTTYSWRVDEGVNGSAASDPNTITGPVWSFKTTKFDAAPTVVIDTPNTLTWVNKPVQLNATVNDTGESAVTITWSSSQDPNTVFSDIHAEDPTVTINYAFPTNVTLTCSVQDEANPTPNTDTVALRVYADACTAARVGAGMAAQYPMDFTPDCVINLSDFVPFASEWLTDYTLTDPIPVP